MPSLYEPCGLNQMYSLKYGTPPIVRRTGGLADTVEPFLASTGAGTGFLFDAFTPEGFEGSLDEALATFAHPQHWRILQRNGMSRDFSWERQGRHYEALYARLCG
jgi:starch synthase